MALHFGILETIFIFLVLGILLNKVLKTVFHQRKILIGLGILFLAVSLKAEVEPQNKKIQHPGAKEGLVKIKKDGSYIYDVKYELKDESSHIRFGQANQPELTITIQSLDASGKVTGENTLNFEDFYENASNFIIGYDYEWFPYADKARFGIQAGFSAMVVTGNGKLVAAPNPASVESYTFATLPLTLGGVYRLEWKDKQMLAPYVAGGATYVVLAEKREDKSAPEFIGGFGFYGAGGVLLNIGAIDRDTSFQLDSEYGIGNMWLSLEFRVIEVNGEAFSFSNKYVNAGLSFDF